ncbi:MAG: ScnB-like protein [Pseudomonadota bacterium]
MAEMPDTPAAPPRDAVSAQGRPWHDLGGTPAGAIARGEHDYALWEKRVDALQVILSTGGHFTVDGLRRALEGMGPGAFETMTYYERWVAAIAENMVETGAIGVSELQARMEEVAARGTTYGEAQRPPGASGD